MNNPTPIPENAGPSEQAAPRRRLQERQPWHRRLRWGDLVITGVIALVAVGLLLSAPRNIAGQTRIAVLTEDGRTVFSKPTAELQAAGSFPFEAQGYHYLIDYENGAIRFAEADCPDRVCVRTGWVERTGQISACVPGHLILKISGPAAGTDDIDIIMQ